MKDSDPSEPAILHDQISDTIISWCGEDAADFQPSCMARETNYRVERVRGRVGKRSGRLSGPTPALQDGDTRGSSGAGRFAARTLTRSRECAAKACRSSSSGLVVRDEFIEAA